MTKLRAIIADDEPDAIEILSSLLAETNKVDIIESFSDPLKVESAINKHKPDVLFLDIEMPGLNGLNLLENIRSYNQDLPVIYTTAYNKYISEAIKLNVFSYLLKPVNRVELAKLVDNLLCLSQAKTITTNCKFKIPVLDGFVYLSSNDLFSLQAEGNYTRIKTIYDDEFISSYNMGRLFSKLPQPLFKRINRSCILNSDFIFRINKKRNTCIARLNEQEIELEISNVFITEFNKLNV